MFKGNKRFYISLFLALTLLFNLMPVTNATDLPFTDVSTSSTFYEAIKYCYDKGIMRGTAPTEFSPNAHLERAMMVTILYRISGSSMRRAPTGFTDVPAGSYFYYAVGWAQYFNIVNGVSSTSFAPDDTVSHEQMMVMLYRYATNYENYTYSLISGSYAAGLNDYSIIDSYARAAVNWALNCGIIDEGTTWFHPSMGTSRQWCAQYLFDFLSKVLGTGKSFAIRSLSVGRSSNISYIISSMGYQSCLGYDLTPREMKFALQNSKILFSHSHGGDDSIVLNGGSLTAADIRKNSLSNLELAYISACYAGNNFITALRDTGGAGAVVGFKSTISAGSDSNGIHYFNERFFYYLKNGNSIYNSIRKARADTYEVYKAYYGSDQAVYYGSYHAN